MVDLRELDGVVGNGHSSNKGGDSNVRQGCHGNIQDRSGALDSNLASRADDDGLDAVVVDVDHIEDGDGIDESFAGPRLALNHEIKSYFGQGKCGPLYRRRPENKSSFNQFFKYKFCPKS